MITKLFYFILTLLFSSSVFAVYLTEDSEARGMAISVMNQQYSKESYVEKYHCWLVNDEENTHCLAIQRADTVYVEGKQRLFILISNITDVSIDGVLYGHPSTGVLAAFLLEKEEDGSWSYKASSKIIQSGGSMGETGAFDARFVELGVNYYGWIFSQGYYQQGYQKFDYVILGVKDNEFVNLVDKLPASCGKPKPQIELEYKIQIVNKNKNSQIYPIKLNEFKADKMTNSYTVGFNYAKWKYNQTKAYCESFEF